jgi:glycerate 2-kinase
LLSKKKVLIAMGSFKDVFSPLESKNLIKNILHESNCNFDITTLSIADGGEYSHEVVKDNLNCIEINLKNIISAHKKKVDSGYLLLDSKTAFIRSSHILRLNNEDDKFKNPLNLTSFGLGQLIKHAIFSSKVSKVFIGLGGTNTVDGGVGMLQALGTIFLDKLGNKLEPRDSKFFSGCDLKNIYTIKNHNETLYKNINVTALCDGTINVDEMYTPNNQKIGISYYSEKDFINKNLVDGINKYVSVINNQIYKKSIMGKEFFGVAGGINLSLYYLFNHEMKLGINFFIEKLQIAKKIKTADLIITGEGRFDNSLGGKAPVGISQLARKYNKEVLYLVGDIIKDYESYFKGSLADKLPPLLVMNGISTIISCHSYNKNLIIPNNMLDKKFFFRKNTEIVFKEAISEFLQSKNWTNPS